MIENQPDSFGNRKTEDSHIESESLEVHRLLETHRSLSHDLSGITAEQSRLLTEVADVEDVLKKLEALTAREQEIIDQMTDTEQQIASYIRRKG